LAGVVLGLLASVLFARPGVVITQSGQRFEGEIKEQPKDVTITVKGIQTTVDRSDIASLIYTEDVQKLYERRLSRLSPHDVQGRIELAQWAVEQNRSDLALNALDQAMKIDPNNAHAYDFIQLIQAQRGLQTTSGPATRTTPRPATRTTRASSRTLVTAQDINTIRQMELKRDDTGVRVRISNDVRRQYVNRAGTTFRAFDDLNPAEQAWLVLNQGDSHWRKGVSILSDPPALTQYKRVIQPVILAGCAASGCHGEAAAGGFRLYSPPVSDAVSYTNFYILTEYVKTLQNVQQSEGAFAGPTQIRMLDRTQPDHSLLAQYGLPRGAAKWSHPAVHGLRPIYRNREGQRYQDLTHWLSHSLVNVQPDYGITDVQLPTTGPSSRPSTRPTPATGRGATTNK
jgi:hypothetical protein